MFGGAKRCFRRDADKNQLIVVGQGQIPAVWFVRLEKRQSEHRSP